jgi:hypothetical protein
VHRARLRTAPGCRRARSRPKQPATSGALVHDIAGFDEWEAGLRRIDSEANYALETPVGAVVLIGHVADEGEELALHVPEGTIDEQIRAAVRAAVMALDLIPLPTL